jgi:hypothetical protein
MLQGGEYRVKEDDAFRKLAFTQGSTGDSNLLTLLVGKVQLGPHFKSSSITIFAKQLNGCLLSA